MTIFQKRFSVLFPGTFVTAFLFSLFSLAFIITPYWTVGETPTSRLVLLMVTIVTGLVWCVAAGAGLRAHFEPIEWVIFAMLLAAMAALNFQQLTGVIPWRGDEDFHIAKTLFVAQKFVLIGKWILLGLIAYTVFLFLAWKKPRWAEIAGALITLGVVVFFIEANPFARQFPVFLLRYPFVSYWFAAIAPAVAQTAGDPYHEVLYRLLPLVFAGALAWTYQRHLPSSNSGEKLLWGLSVATIPLVFYYTSISYLEMPAVFLMLVVCFRIKDLLYLDAAQLKSSPVWYCLILIGFIKETTLPFLLCFVACRWAVQYLKQKPRSPLYQPQEGSVVERQAVPFAARFLGELGVAFAVLMPLFLYLGFRNTLWGGRGYGMQLSNLIQPKAYIAFAKSFIEQFGVFMLFFIGGCILLVKRKEYATVAFFLLAFVGIPLFHITDNWIFAGYSRFNLFVLPLVLTGSAVFFCWVYERKKAASLVMGCLAIVASLAITPIRLDGSKQPYWDSYNINTSEHYYPYREAITWLKDTHPNEKVLIVGWTTSYYIDFYAGKYDWKNWEVLKRDRKIRNEADFISHALATAKKQKTPVVLVHVISVEFPVVTENSGYQQEMIIQNSGHSLIVYRQGP